MNNADPTSFSIQMATCSYHEFMATGQIPKSILTFCHLQVLSLSVKLLPFLVSKNTADVNGLTPSEAAIMDCRLGIESALSIFGMICISALAAGYEKSTKTPIRFLFPSIYSHN
jgi:hypothetical protein